MSAKATRAPSTKAIKISATALLLSLVLASAKACPFTVEIRQALDRAALITGLDPRLLYAQAWVESRFCPQAVSPRGAIGLLQVLPSTASELGVKDPSLLYLPWLNAEVGAKYLKGLYLQWGNWRLALAAYNAGPGAVAKHQGIPPYPETQQYVGKVLSAYRYYTQFVPTPRSGE